MIAFFRFVCAATLALSCCGCLAAGRLVKLSLGGSGLGGLDGARTFYLYSASSQAEIQTAINVFEIPFLKGESVLLEAEQEKIETRRAAAIEAVKKQGGNVVREEWSNGVCSLYCQLPERLGLYDGVAVFGELVNLHIALAETRTVVGSPIVFGGY